MVSYDSEMIAGELESLSEIQATAFAAACAELLIRFFAADIPHEAIDGDVLRTLVDALWISASPEESYTRDAASDSEVLHSVLLGDYAEELGTGEHAISGIYYAIEAIRSGNHLKNELVARKLYEAAYYTVLAKQESGLLSKTALREVVESSLVQQALGFIFALFPMIKDIPSGETGTSVRSYAKNFMLTFE